MQLSDKPYVVVGEHTLGAVFPNGLQIIRASVLRGSPYPSMGVVAFDKNLQAGQWRYATEQDFADYNVSSVGVDFNARLPD